MDELGALCSFLNTLAPSRDCRQRLRTLGYAAQAAPASLHGGTILLILLSAPLYTHFFSIFSIFSIAIRLAYSCLFCPVSCIF